MRTRLSVHEAQSEVLSRCRKSPTEMVEADAALGRTLAEAVVAREDIPPFASSAMDGFVLGPRDRLQVPFTLRVEGELAAGARPAACPEPGCCLRIMTGAPVPSGADCVVPVEWTDDGHPAVRIDRLPPAGGHIRPAGQEATTGEVVISPGTRIGAGAAGMLASLGCVRVPVRARPSVAIISTGRELVPPGGERGPGQIFDSNASAIAAQALEAGAVVHGSHHADDDTAAIGRALGATSGADMVVLTGGVSMGRYDLVREALAAAGFEALFWKVMQRPGQPLLFGVLDGRPVFGLPGNPVSSSVCFDQYVRPAIRTMLASREVFRPRYATRLAAPFRKVGGLHTFARSAVAAATDGRLEARPTGPQGSNLFSSVLKANALVHLPAAWESAPEGAEAEFEWVDW